MLKVGLKAISRRGCLTATRAYRRGALQEENEMDKAELLAEELAEKSGIDVAEARIVLNEAVTSIADEELLKVSGGAGAVI